jgi:hypothetical protein
MIPVVENAVFRSGAEALSTTIPGMTKTPLLR